jgi:stage II sporulation protein D
VYRGTNTATSNSDAAVDATYGLCIKYDGKYIDAVYHSSSGGATEKAVNVWTSDVPYLQPVKDSYEDETKIREQAVIDTYNGGFYYYS